MSLRPSFSGKKLQRGCSVKRWHRKQIKNFITKNTNTTQQQNRDHFDIKTRGRRTNFMSVMSKYEPMKQSHLNHEDQLQHQILMTK